MLETNPEQLAIAIRHFSSSFCNLTRWYKTRDYIVNTKFVLIATCSYYAR